MSSWLKTATKTRHKTKTSLTTTIDLHVLDLRERTESVYCFRWRV